MPQAAVMRDLFDRVAWRYDLANKVLSLGSDRRWRGAVAREVVRDNPKLVLDVCSGTADQILAIQKRKDFGGRVMGLDISPQMLRRGQEKLRCLGQAGEAVLSDVHDMPWREAIFDCVTICFGVRNFSDMDQGLKEIARVLRPGGKIIILEFTPPANPLLGSIYRFYLTKILPRVGGVLTGQGDAYRYLATSIEGFLTPGQLTCRLEASGFVRTQHRFLSAGVVAITTAEKRRT